MGDVPFDRVRLTGESRGIELSLDEFLKLPLPLRIRHILAREIEFFSANVPVDRGEALRRLSAWQTGAEARI